MYKIFLILFLFSSTLNYCLENDSSKSSTAASSNASDAAKKSEDDKRNDEAPLTLKNFSREEAEKMAPFEKKVLGIIRAIYSDTIYISPTVSFAEGINVAEAVFDEAFTCVQLQDWYTALNDLQKLYIKKYMKNNCH